MRENVMAWLLAAVLLLTMTAGAGDWPHWRGPSLNGAGEETNLPAGWSLTENIAWSAPLPGDGYATPIVSKGRVFISSADRQGSDLLALCFDVETGKQLWRKAVGSSARKVPRNNNATPSPTVDGKRVFFLYGDGELAGLDYQGKILWQRNLEKEYGNVSMKWGYSSSPLYYDGKLYVLMQRRHTSYREPEGTGLDAFLLAVDTATGKNIWKQPRVTDAVNESLDSYTSPLLFQHNGRTEILIIGGDYVTGQDPATGKEFWRWDYDPRKETKWRNVPSVVTGGGLIFGVRPRGGNGLFALKAGGNGNLGKAAVAWEFNGPTPDSPTPLFYRDRLYVLDGRRKIVTCLEPKTGRQIWQGKLPGRATYYASLTAGDGKLYTISEEGEAAVLAAGGEFKLLHTVNMGGKPICASIAIAEGRLFIRTVEKLYCIMK